jgi:hypothetical protein
MQTHYKLQSSALPTPKDSFFIIENLSGALPRISSVSGIEFIEKGFHGSAMTYDLRDESQNIFGTAVLEPSGAIKVSALNKTDDIDLDKITSQAYHEAMARRFASAMGAGNNMINSGVNSSDYYYW